MLSKMRASEISVRFSTSTRKIKWRRADNMDIGGEGRQRKVEENMKGKIKE